MVAEGATGKPSGEQVRNRQARSDEGIREVPFRTSLPAE